MPKRARDGASLEQLLLLAIPLCMEAQKQCPRTGPGRPPDYQDWQIAALIVCCVLKKKKSINSQFNFIQQNKDLFLKRLKLDRLPSRGTFFDRYKTVWPLVQIAIELQGRAAIREHVVNARDVAVDKSLMAARGPQWNTKDRKRNVVPKGLRGLDRQADWGYSEYHNWVYGYSYEIAVTATKGSIVFPLLASVDTASANEHKTSPPKLKRMPPSTRNGLFDRGYDSNDAADAFELDAHEQPNGRRFVCPTARDFVSQIPERGRRERQRQRRIKRHAFVKSRKGQALYHRRGKTIEPLNAIFKDTFELSDHVWHRGLNNNRTQVLCAVFAYQLLIRHHWKNRGRDAQIRYLMDGL